MGIHIPHPRKWNHKHIILATLTGTLVVITMAAIISIILSPAHISLSIAKPTKVSKADQEDTQRYNFTLVAQNRSPHMAVVYGCQPPWSTGAHCRTGRRGRNPQTSSSRPSTGSPSKGAPRRRQAAAAPAGDRARRQPAPMRRTGPTARCWLQPLCGSGIGRGSARGHTTYGRIARL